MKIKVLPKKNFHEEILASRFSTRLMDVIGRYIDLNQPGDIAIVETSSALNLINVHPKNGHENGQIDSIINLKKINNIRYVNKFMEGANQKLNMGGYLIGCVETSGQRRKRLMKKFKTPFNGIYFFFDYLFKRVWPKLPYLKKIYFLLTHGRNRVISEMETYGRLYSCGFNLIETIEEQGMLYFIAEKMKDPDYNMKASYGPIIRLKRMGKNGKCIEVYKFRTMYPYSEYIQDFVYERWGLRSGGKINNDPRVNRLGRFLRKYWLDELPMLLNFLRGEIKLVGVRPISFHYFSLYPKDFQTFRRRFKPGLIPPFYVDLPKTTEEIVASEYRYLKAYEKNPFRTDLTYLFKALYNILIRRVRSH